METWGRRKQERGADNTAFGDKDIYIYIYISDMTAVVQHLAAGYKKSIQQHHLQHRYWRRFTHVASLHLFHLISKESANCDAKASLDISSRNSPWWDDPLDIHQLDTVLQRPLRSHKWRYPTNQDSAILLQQKQVFGGRTERSHHTERIFLISTKTRWL